MNAELGQPDLMSPEGGQPAAGGEPVPPEPDPRAERFRRVAAGRANRVLAALSLLEATADRAHYRYTDEQVLEILTSIQTALGSLQSAYQNGGRHRTQKVAL